MPFEIVESPHLPPARCAACGCAESGPHVFLPTNAAWEYNWVFLCRKCVTEMAGALGITAPEKVVERIEVMRDPTEQELLDLVASRFTLVPVAPDIPAEVGNALARYVMEKVPGEPPGSTPVERCVCGRGFDGPTAKAKLASHQRTCKEATIGDAVRK